MVHCCRSCRSYGPIQARSAPPRSDKVEGQPLSLVLRRCSPPSYHPLSNLICLCLHYLHLFLHSVFNVVSLISCLSYAPSCALLVPPRLRQPSSLGRRRECYPLTSLASLLGRPSCRPWETPLQLLVFSSCYLRNGIFRILWCTRSLILKHRRPFSEHDRLNRIQRGNPLSRSLCRIRNDHGVFCSHALYQTGLRDFFQVLLFHRKFLSGAREGGIIGAYHSLRQPSVFCKSYHPQALQCFYGFHSPSHEALQCHGIYQPRLSRELLDSHIAGCCILNLYGIFLEIYGHCALRFFPFCSFSVGWYHHRSHQYLHPPQVSLWRSLKLKLQQSAPQIPLPSS